MADDTGLVARLTNLLNPNWTQRMSQQVTQGFKANAPAGLQQGLAALNQSYPMQVAQTAPLFGGIKTPSPTWPAPGTVMEPIASGATRIARPTMPEAPASSVLGRVNPLTENLTPESPLGMGTSGAEKIGPITGGIATPGGAGLTEQVGAKTSPLGAVNPGAVNLTPESALGRGASGAIPLGPPPPAEPPSVLGRVNTGAQNLSESTGLGGGSSGASVLSPEEAVDVHATRLGIGPSGERVSGGGTAKPNPLAGTRWDPNVAKGTAASTAPAGAPTVAGAAPPETAPASWKPGWKTAAVGAGGLAMLGGAARQPNVAQPAVASAEGGPTQAEMLGEQEAPFNQQMGTFNSKPITWNQAHDLAGRLPTVPAGTMPTAMYNASGVGANPASDRGEAIMAAARSGAIKPDEALRMLNGEEPRAAGPQVASLGGGASQESAYAKDVRESNAMRDLWGIEGDAARTGANPKQILARLEAHNQNPLYGGGTRLEGIENKPESGLGLADRIALLNAGQQGRKEELAARGQQAIELDKQRAAEAAANASERTRGQLEGKQRIAQQAEDNDLLRQFQNPAAAQSYLTQLTGKFGPDVARLYMTKLNPKASGEELAAQLNQILKGG
jgi:hypothetical protein